MSVSESEYIWNRSWTPIGVYGLRYRFNSDETGHYFDLDVPNGLGGWIGDWVALPLTTIDEQRCRERLYRRVYSWECYLQRNGMVDVVR